MTTPQIKANQNNELGYFLQNGLSTGGQIAQAAGADYQNIAWFQQAVMGGYNTFSGSSSHDQRVGGIQSMINAVVCFIGKAASAEKDVDESDKEINDGKNKVEDTRTENEKKIDKLLEEIEKNTKSIKDIIEELEKLGNTDFKGLQEELKETQEEIEENIEKLKKDPNDEEALNRIEELSKYIKDELLPKADTLIEVINGKTAKVGVYQAKIEVASADANEVIAANLNEIKAIENETAKEAIKNAGFTITGEGEVATAAELQASAAATEVGSFGMGTAAAAEIEKKALDYMEAGTTHISGSAKNLTTLGTALGEIGGDFTKVAGCINKVGSALNDAVKLVGQYQAQSTEMITSIGTWKDETSKKQEELQAAIDEYKGNGTDEEGNAICTTANKDQETSKLLNFKFDTKAV